MPDPQSLASRLRERAGEKRGAAALALGDRRDLLCHDADLLTEAADTLERVVEAVERIARNPIPERNPDGVDQAAETMRLIAREALGLPGEGS